MSHKLTTFLKSLTVSSVLTLASAHASAKPANHQPDLRDTPMEMKISKQRKAQKIQQLANDYKKYAYQFEGCLLRPYIDPTGYIVIGIGTCVNSEKEFCALELRNSNMQLLTNKQKKGYYRLIAAYRDKITKNGKCTVKTSKQQKFTCKITSDYAEQLFLARTTTLITELDAKLTKLGMNFMAMPRNVELGLTDMVQTLGVPRFSPKNWPNLFGALKEGDYLTASRENRIVNVQAARNDWRKKLFVDAYNQTVFAGLLKKGTKNI